MIPQNKLIYTHIYSTCLAAHTFLGRRTYFSRQKKYSLKRANGVGI